MKTRVEGQICSPPLFRIHGAMFGIPAAARFTSACTTSILCKQAWRTPYKAARGRRALGTRPYVHCGFLRSWTAQGFNQRLVARMRDIVAAMPLKGRRARILITGGRFRRQPVTSSSRLPSHTTGTRRRRWRRMTLLCGDHSCSCSLFCTVLKTWR